VLTLRLSSPGGKYEEAAKLIWGGYGFIVAGAVMFVYHRFISGYS
jgi:hypothetical protein